MKVRSLILSLAAVMGLALASCDNSNDETGGLSLSRTSGIVMQGSSLTITATYGDEDVTTSATWTSSDEAIATVDASASPAQINGVSAGQATITCTYNGETATCNVTVGATSIDADRLLGGSDYYIFQMGDGTVARLGDNVAADLRPNGGYNDDGTVPEGVTRVIQIWGNTAAAGTTTGANSFGDAEDWFSMRQQDGEWAGAMSGGMLIMQEDTEFQKLQNLTPEHVLVITYRGNYTPTEKLTISMGTTDGANTTDTVIFEATETTGANKDGGWDVAEIPYADLLAMGFDFADVNLYTNDWFAWTFNVDGSGNTIDIDALYFYVPAE